MKRKTGSVQVAPFMGAWIEISLANTFTTSIPVAPFMGAWIEIYA